MIEELSTEQEEILNAIARGTLLTGELGTDALRTLVAIGSANVDAGLPTFASAYVGANVFGALERLCADLKDACTQEMEALTPA